MPRVVAVLGGNAFAGPEGRLTMEGQLEFAHEAVGHLKPLLAGDVQLLISHGNGPQVGHMLTRVEASIGKAYSIPLEVCVAESEGELGYILEQSLYNVLSAAGGKRSAISMLTQVVVDEHDPGFNDPQKPIGPFYDADQADELRAKGFRVIEDSGRGFRRVVPSPAPVEIIEMDVIRRLFEMEIVVIAAGGGGIPVIRQADQLVGVEAVIDKDSTACLLAEELNSDLLVILTCVPCAYRNFKLDDEEAIGRISVGKAWELIGEGHFAAGSMLPKMKAAAQFASRPGRKCIICDPASLADALKGTAGTIVEAERE